MEILHLTDLHLVRSNAFQRELVAKLLSDLAAAKDAGQKIDFMIFSGDLVNNPDDANIYEMIETLPIRLTQTPTRCRVDPRSGIKLGIGRRFNAAGDAEQRAEGVERVEAPVEAEREFIEVGL
jgi:3',5'-cyclic AMP phosphodiesterase CpdA